mgnify:CR=1 FL=1|tara:strand:- start:217 stop:915 length:699 start_codon:yes stop_codon:yes gene_type:complete
MIQYLEGDIHEKIKELEDNSIDLIYTDPPFNVSKCKWDKPLKWSELFTEMWRVLKPNGIIILYSSMPFTYELIKYEKPKYHYIWIKNNSTGFLTCKYQPLRQTEEVFIYYKKRGTYNPQMVGDKIYKKRNVKYGGKNAFWGKDGINKKNEYNKDEGHIGNYPTNIRYDKIEKGKKNMKPQSLSSYFIKTYSNENDTILDMCCNNEIVGNICKELNRSYIGVDLNINFIIDDV